MEKILAARQSVIPSNGRAPVRRTNQAALLAPTDAFVERHLGPNPAEVDEMLAVVGAASLDELIDQTVPPAIRLGRALRLPAPRPESDVLAEMAAMAARNRLHRSFIGMGYYDTLTPGVILRTIMENPGWYTQYTPYQAEIAQGRLEALLNFQTLVSDLTGLDIANASLLDEATAAAEAKQPYILSLALAGIGAGADLSLSTLGQRGGAVFSRRAPVSRSEAHDHARPSPARMAFRCLGAIDGDV